MAAMPMPLIEVQTMGQDLAQRTVCVKVRLGRLGNTRKVSNSQVEVDTDKSLIRVSKHLLDSKELRTIANFDGEIRRYLYDTCLPFEAGIHLCPLPLLEQMESKLREFAARRKDLIDAFLTAYPALCQDAAKRLRSLYNPADYPPLEYVEQQFTLIWQYISFGVPDQLREISTKIWHD
ncbi:MAG: hypothetical protein ACREXY_28630, partial [Gammaproteobacteria bacterium]